MLKIEDTVFILIDFQGKLAEIVDDNEKVKRRLTQVVQGLQQLEVPIIWMEQYPKGLGDTHPDIKNLLIDEQYPYEKMIFNACGNREVASKLKTLNRKQVVVAGIEAHICVYQTVRELVTQGYEVEFIEDAISSRTKENKEIAVRKMTALGAMPTNVEMLLFELLKTAEHPQFKTISKLIK